MYIYIYIVVPTTGFNMPDQVLLTPGDWHTRELNSVSLPFYIYIYKKYIFVSINLGEIEG